MNINKWLYTDMHFIQTSQKEEVAGKFDQLEALQVFCEKESKLDARGEVCSVGGSSKRSKSRK